MNREIRKLQITIESCRATEQRELLIEVFVNNQVHTVRQLASDDDFESFFDYIMDEAKLKLRRTILSYKPHDGVVTAA